MFTDSLIVVGITLALYWLVVWMRSDHFWNWAFDFTEVEELHPLDLKPVEKLPPSPPVPPRPQKDFGEHYNPLAVDSADICHGHFEQMDARTWQCVECQLLRFEKP